MAHFYPKNHEILSHPSLPPRALRRSATTATAKARTHPICVPEQDADAHRLRRNMTLVASFSNNNNQQPVTQQVPCRAAAHRPKKLITAYALTLYIYSSARRLERRMWRKCDHTNPRGSCVGCFPLFCRDLCHVASSQHRVAFCHTAPRKGPLRRRSSPSSAARFGAAQ